MTKKLALLLTLFAAASVVQADEAYPPVVSIMAKNGNELVFGSNAILSVQLNDDAGLKQVIFQMDGPTAMVFAKLTSENVGNQITFSVCGEIVTRPVIQSPIYGGWLALSGLDEERATEVVDILSGHRLCN